MSLGHRRAWSAVLLAGVLVLAGCTAAPEPPPAPVVPPPPVGGGPPAPGSDGLPRQAFGAFLGSDSSGVEAIGGFEQFLGRPTTVGHTYLPGETWEGIEGPEQILGPWSRWKAEHPGDLFVLNVPMAAPNEAEVGDAEVADLLRRGAAGEYDRHYAELARRLVDRGLQDAVLLPGWEMNGDTYTHRCEPDPEAWKQYYRRVVDVLRAQPGQRFRFDFTPSRGVDAISWPQCYPGDDVVDIIGMDTYDQPPGASWEEYVGQQDGLGDQARFAAEHGKPVSFPEWGLFRYGDNAQYVRDLHAWMASQDTVYSTLTDYCPHGVYRCTQNPQAADAVRELFGTTR
ncbi:hypothetical protein AD006_11755 [Pseudonocardia sp. EC080610-09]|uniref:glycoside hydrolase family 26 protein n=1 Tax=unclassified Pseudonocardia TaxID=2619320 RepID=UPI0006CB2A7F|nr:MULTISPECIES: glycosyl hydrolase [unclassified Pseudonocardia]ALE72497.1 hypothetical protein FRP1_04095 [Pseudonocardia sp. EC080625-04]ALL75810.1 hypothetical protein AD006_11755 [Pseudonocardia sp. EC080610-09]ALL82837.1 hypothetical protein AD017_19580 [Pseudonocardia sp. EC080619-01]